MESLCSKDARLTFEWMIGMLDIIANMGWRYPGKAGSHCKYGREDGAMNIRHHWLTWTAYNDLRRGLDLEDIIHLRVVFIYQAQRQRITLEKEFVWEAHTIFCDHGRGAVVHPQKIEWLPCILFFKLAPEEGLLKEKSCWHLNLKLWLLLWFEVD